MTFGMWFLSVMKESRLRSITWAFPLVGHSHGPIDRSLAVLDIPCQCDFSKLSLHSSSFCWVAIPIRLFFSRLVVGLRTQSYCTFAELEQHCVRSLSGLAEIP